MNGIDEGQKKKEGDIKFVLTSLSEITLIRSLTQLELDKKLRLDIEISEQLLTHQKAISIHDDGILKNKSALDLRIECERLIDEKVLNYQRFIYYKNSLPISFKNKSEKIWFFFLNVFGEKLKYIRPFYSFVLFGIYFLILELLIDDNVKASILDIVFYGILPISFSVILWMFLGILREQYLEFIFVKENYLSSNQPEKIYITSGFPRKDPDNIKNIRTEESFGKTRILLDDYIDGQLYIKLYNLFGFNKPNFFCQINIYKKDSNTSYTQFKTKIATIPYYYGPENPQMIRLFLGINGYYGEESFYYEIFCYADEKCNLLLGSSYPTPAWCYSRADYQRKWYREDDKRYPTREKERKDWQKYGNRWSELYLIREEIKYEAEIKKEDNIMSDDVLYNEFLPVRKEMESLQKQFLGLPTVPDNLFKEGKGWFVQAKKIKLLNNQTEVVEKLIQLENKFNELFDVRVQRIKTMTQGQEAINTFLQAKENEKLIPLQTDVDKAKLAADKSDHELRIAKNNAEMERLKGQNKQKPSRKEKLAEQAEELDKKRLIESIKNDIRNIRNTVQSKSEAEKTVDKVMSKVELEVNIEKAKEERLAKAKSPEEEEIIKNKFDEELFRIRDEE